MPGTAAPRRLGFPRWREAGWRRPRSAHGCSSSTPPPRAGAAHRGRATPPGIPDAAAKPCPVWYLTARSACRSQPVPVSIRSRRPRSGAQRTSCQGSAVPKSQRYLPSRRETHRRLIPLPAAISSSAITLASRASIMESVSLTSSSIARTNPGGSTSPTAYDISAGQEMSTLCMCRTSRRQAAALPSSPTCASPRTSLPGSPPESLPRARGCSPSETSRPTTASRSTPSGMPYRSCANAA